jgi:hypothetical protein
MPTILRIKDSCISRSFPLTEQLSNTHGEERRLIPTDLQHQLLDRKSAFRLDFRQRLDTFAKSLFFLAGGALTISIGLFLRDQDLNLTSCNLWYLKWSWILLTYTIIATSAAQLTIILQGFYVNQLWSTRTPLSDDQITGNTLMLIARSLIGLLGISAFLAFILGMIWLVFVSIQATLP